MNPKKFKLPKEFAEKWIKALESGEYIQGNGYLASIDEDLENSSLSVCSHCCLGVAAETVGNTRESLLEVEYLYERKHYSGIPEELLSPNNSCNANNSLVFILAHLNDGMGKDTFIQFKNYNYNYRTDIKQHFGANNCLRYDFNQIIEFIKDNVEFY